ncbi:MAG: rhamnogalacturonan acetylesterase [Spirochaetales bacterium]|nr:rhamnogalacturonan acetylesterase [Spirochaetales bacterium]
MSDTRDNLQIFLAGDSTMARKEDREYPENGWGMMVEECFLPGVTFHNEAVNGRSTKSFIDEGRWQGILDRIGPGDYVFIQFGHNDEKREDPSRYADPFGAYSRNLAYFIDSSRAKGANPVLLTSVCRRKFDARGVLEMTHGEYPEAMKVVAAERGVPCIDMESRTAALLTELGRERSIALFMHLAPGIYPNHPEGKADDTHFVEEGARMAASLVAQGIRVALPELALRLKG